MKEQSNPSMIYTPNNHIPIGEAIKYSDGSRAIRIKHPGTNKYDEVTMDYLYEQLLIRTKIAGSRSEQGPAAS